MDLMGVGTSRVQFLNQLYTRQKNVVTDSLSRYSEIREDMIDPRVSINKVKSIPSAQS